jgi:hypothetical protein
MKDTKLDLAVTEIKEAANAVEKEQLLQKYGFIEPKLTPLEQRLIEYEAEGIVPFISREPLDPKVIVKLVLDNWNNVAEEGA